MIDTGLAGHGVLVTGGAGGIGAAICRAFAAQGARLAIHYLPDAAPPPRGRQWEHRTPGPRRAHELAAELGDAVALGADLTTDGADTALLAAATAAIGPLTVLVSNAAHCESPDTLGELDAAGLERHYRVNAVAPALLVQEFARRARAGSDPAPSVVTISTDGARAFAGQIGYGTSKAALEALTRAAALDLAASGIRVNAVAPGPVQTGWITAELVDEVTAVVPMRRLGEPADIADAVVFLASRQARWITGQVVQVAGGHAL